LLLNEHLIIMKDNDNIIINFNHMKKILLVLPAMLLILAGCGSPAASPSNTDTSSSSSTQPSGAQKFSDQSYYSNSYLVSGDNLSADAQRALAGFQLQKKSMPDGTTQITLKALEPAYHDQSYTLKPGEQLYFIDRNLGDDAGGQENYIGEDSAAVVDAQGNVVQPPAGFSQ